MIEDRERLERTFERFEMPEPALERLGRRLRRRRRRQRIAAAATALALVVAGAVLVARLGPAPPDRVPTQPDDIESFSVPNFSPPFTYVGPADADPETFWKGDDVHLGGTERRAKIWVVRNPEVAPRTCEHMAAGTRVRSADDLLAWVAVHPDLATSRPVAVQIGGAPGFQVDLQVRPDAGSLCRGEAKLLAFPAWSYPYHPWSLTPDERARLYVVDVGSGPDAGVVTIVVEAPADRFAGKAAEADPIVRSITFEGSS
jgi:hypothetical protein